MDLSLIIVSFNTEKLTLACVKSICEHKPNLKFEIIVVNNNSSDDTVSSLEKVKTQNRNCDIKIITNSANLGFAKANNQGIKIARGKFILLLNSDTEITPGAVDKLVNFARKTTDAGVVGARLLNPDGSIQASVFKLPTLLATVKQYWLGMGAILDKFVPAGNLPVEVESLTMAACLITPKALMRVGLLNERYFMYFEDHDYCKRVKNSGLKVYYLPTAEVIHHHGASGSKLAGEVDQWRRLIPSSIIYHGIIIHSLIYLVMWSSQKWQSLTKK